MALCSLSTGRIATRRRRAASIISAPAITSTSLFARAIDLPASIAASTASSAAVPDDAQRTMSDVGMCGHRHEAVSAAATHRAITRTQAVREVVERSGGRNAGQSRPVLLT